MRMQVSEQQAANDKLLLISAFDEKLSNAKLAIRNGASPSAVNANGETALHGAAQNGHFEIAKLLLGRGAPPSAITKYGDTPLHYAAFYGHPKIVELLLMRGAKPDKVNQYGSTPLQETVEKLIGSEQIPPDYAKTIDLLLKNGADPVMKNRFNYPVIEYAMLKGNEGVARFLENAVNEVERHKASNIDGEHASKLTQSRIRLAKSKANSKPGIVGR